MKTRKFFVLWGPVITWCLVIFGLSSIPTLPAPKIYLMDFIIKKTAHLGEYAMLYILVFRAANNLEFRIKNLEFRIRNYNLKLNYLMPFIFGIFYAMTDEIHQKFVPGRHCKLMDIGIDFTGMLIGKWLIDKYFLHFLSQKQTNY